MIRTFMHNITHRHHWAAKEGMGEFIFCRWRLVTQNGDVWYRPDFDGAAWHKVPEMKDEDFSESKAARMMKADSSEQAMAILREETA